MVSDDNECKIVSQNSSCIMTPQGNKFDITPSPVPPAPPAALVELPTAADIGTKTDVSPPSLHSPLANQDSSKPMQVDHQYPSRIFLDICSGSTRPLSSAILALGGDVCSIDILFCSTYDLLDDAFDLDLLRWRLLAEWGTQLVPLLAVNIRF